MNILYFFSNRIYMSAFYIEDKVCNTSKCAIQVNKVGLKPTYPNIRYSPPQTQGGCETNLKLSTKVRRHPLGCDLVKIFVS